MKKFTIYIIFCIVFPNLVFANNFYAGIDLGESKKKTTESTPANSATHYYLLNGSSFNINGRDNLTGLHFGYNHFINNFFIGPELRFINNSKDNVITAGRFGENNYTIKYDDTKTLALRFGIVENKISYYLLGGYAQSNIYTNVDESSAGIHVGSSKLKHNGIVLGIGVETTVLENISIGFQYNEINLKNKNQTINDNAPGGDYQGPDVVSVNPNIKTLSIRASYLF
jgi:opacity protein-like surface antigen